jgi:iron complex outermembrane receptor protein
MSLDYSKEENVQNVYDISGGGLYELDGEDGWDRSISTNKGDFFNRDVVGALVRGDFGLRRHTFTTLSAYRSFEAENFNDQDYSILDIVGTGRREELDFLSQEFRLASTSGAPFSYLVGLYFSDRTTKGRDRFRFGAAIPVLFGIGDIPGYEEWLVATSTIEEQVSAGFLSGSWAFSERGTFEFGFRYTSEDKAIGYRQDALPFYLSPGVPVGIIYALGPDVAPIHQGRSDSDPSGDLSLVYRLSEDVNGYARYAHGFKAGGFDSTVSSSSNPGDLEFDSEKVDAFELGIKSMLADTKVQLNAALFYMNYQDKQEQFFTGSEFRTGNAASVTSKGVEFELKVLPASGVEIFTTVGYTDASYEKFIDPVLGTDLSGNRLLAPKWTGSLAIQYYRPFAGSMGWFIRGAAHYRGENFTTVDNDPRWAQDAHTLVDARAGMDFRGGRYTVAIWGKNLTDVGYILTGYEFFGTTYQAVSEPRTFGVELRLRR